MSERKTFRKMLEEENERRKKILGEVLEKHSWAVELEDLDGWLNLIDDFNRQEAQQR